jgi:hypothetical protein
MKMYGEVEVYLHHSWPQHEMEFIFRPEDGGSMLRWNVSSHKNYTVLYSRNYNIRTFNEFCSNAFLHYSYCTDMAMLLALAIVFAK